MVVFSHLINTGPLKFGSDYWVLHCPVEPAWAGVGPVQAGWRLSQAHVC